MYGTIYFYVTFSPNEGGFFFFKEPLKIIQKLVVSISFYISIDIFVDASKISSYSFYALSKLCTIRPKLGVFCKFNMFGCCITQLIKKPKQWSLYEVIKNILPFVLNTKRPRAIFGY